jgi:catechol 2,3-dioxygenase-like lactoylglutathione lyase family enzyme
MPPRLDHAVIHVSDWAGAVEHLGRHGIEVEEGPGARQGARGEGISVYFRDPDGSLLEFISYG